MMISVHAFKPSDIDAIEPQPAQSIEMLTKARAGELRGWAFTARDELGRILMCAGALPAGDVWWGWALLSIYSRRRMLALTRAVLALLPHTPAAKVRIGVRWGFPEGHAWAVLLGFRSVPELQAHGGICCAVYERELAKQVTAGGI